MEAAPRCSARGVPHVPHVLHGTVRGTEGAEVARCGWAPGGKGACTGMEVLARMRDVVTGACRSCSSGGRGHGHVGGSMVEALLAVVRACSGA